MTGISRFGNSIGRAMTSLLLPLLQKEQEHVRKHGSPAFDVSLPLISPTLAKLTRDQRYLSTTFSAYAEIEETLHRLQDIPIYLRRFPFRRNGIPHDRYLRHHVEGYFHEIHILRERMIYFSTRTARAHRRSPGAATVKRASAAAAQLAIQALAQITAIRGRHVHESRFDETHLRNLAALEMTTKSVLDPTLSRFIKKQRRAAVAYWANWTVDMNKSVALLADKYFDLHYSALFTSEGAPRYP